MKIAIINVTTKSKKLSEKLCKLLKNENRIILFNHNDVKKKGIIKITEFCFIKFDAIIFISSTGIAVRAISLFIKNKFVDPAVLVIDATGTFVISLLSGHIGGANQLTLKISSLLKAKSVITTATDNLNILAPDVLAKKFNLIIDDKKLLKAISTNLVNNKPVYFYDEEKKINPGKGYFIIEKSNLNFNMQNTLLITNRQNNGFKGLKLIRKNLILGVGCRKNYKQKIMVDSVSKILKNLDFDWRSVKSIVSVEIKKNEKAIINLAKHFKAELNFFKIEEIKKIEKNFIGSEFVKNKIGVRAVAEPCVVLYKGNIIKPKIKIDGMTLAIGTI